MEAAPDIPKWYECWFGSPFYHMLYRHRDDKEAQLFLDTLLGFLHPPDDSKICDIGCGRGRHALYLAQKGYCVTGIDLSPENISSAIECLSAFPHLCEKNLTYQTHDMRNVFKENYFDIALNLFTSFGYFTEEQEYLNTLAAVRKGLKNEGLFILDFLNVHKAVAHLKKEELKICENIRFHITRDVSNGFIIKKIRVETYGEELPEKCYFFEERVKAFTLPDFKKYFHQTGFEIRDVFGSYRLDAFDEENSDRLIIVSGKKSD